MTAKILLAAAAAAALSACIDVSGSNGFRCETEAPAITGQRGDTTLTAIELKWLETEVGTGTTARACDGVAVYYRGYVAGSATPFDSVVTGNPAGYVAGGAQLRITGLDVGVIGMKQGGKRRLFIPPQLGFGNTPVTFRNITIPANSTLIFDVELRQVTPRND